MESIDPEGMNLAVTVAGDVKPVRSTFDHTLEGQKTPHPTLVAMLKRRESRVVAEDRTHGSNHKVFHRMT